MEKDSNFKNVTSEQIVDDEIDLKIIFYLILRNKVLIGITSLITFFLAVFYSLNLKKVWEGHFQIVLNSEQDYNLNSINPALSNFISSKCFKTTNFFSLISIFNKSGLQ